MSSPATSTTRLGGGTESARKRPIWKRKIFIFGSILAVVVIVVAVVVPVEVIKRNNSRPKYSEQELYFPNGGLNGVLRGTNSASSNQNPANQSYDELLVFGSSYSDNAHPRAQQYSASLPSGDYWHNHWSNGPIWVEYLTSLLGPNVTLRDYAYGGAVIQRILSPNGPPTMGEQMQTYLSDLSTNISTSSSPSSVLQRKALVPTFTTTNDITSVYQGFLDPTSSSHNNLTTALDTISASANLFIENLRTLIPSSNSTSNSRNRTPPDFLILPILPVNLTPQSIQLAKDANTTTDAVKNITIRYNEVLMNGARSLADTLGDRGSVFTYDVTAWFNEMAANSSRYSLVRLDKGCSQVGCSNPKRYIFWDHLHLVTSMQQRLAQSCAQVVMQQIPRPRNTTSA